MEILTTPAQQTHKDTCEYCNEPVKHGEGTIVRRKLYHVNCAEKASKMEIEGVKVINKDVIKPSTPLNPNCPYCGKETILMDRIISNGIPVHKECFELKRYDQSVYNTASIDSYAKDKLKMGFHTFSTGAQRQPMSDVRYDLICPAGLLALAKTYAEGAAKYSDYNWCKGIPISNLLNHALNHIDMWRRGDRTEDHLGHALWNIVAIIHFETKCTHHVIAQEMDGLDAKETNADSSSKKDK